MAIIGKNKAVADLPKPEMHFRGFIAWAMWLFIHLMSLISYRNRATTFYNWRAICKRHSLRTISGKIKQKKDKEKKSLMF